MSGEQDNMDDLDGTQLTEDCVKNDVEKLGAKPSVNKVQEILDRIATIEDGERRTLLFMTAKQYLKRELRPMVTESQKRAAKFWAENLAKQKFEAEANPFEFDSEEGAVEAINQKCQMVWWNGGVRYVFWDADGFPVFGLKRDAEDYYAKYQFLRYDTKGFPKYTPAFDLWRKSRHRREYAGVGFFPDASTARENFLNLWMGLSIKPAPEGEGDWSLLRAHIFENICNGNQEHFDYLMDWCSQMLFEPAQKSGVIVVLRGDPGTGKTKLGEWLCNIIGWRHSVELTQEEHLTGKFNAHIEMMLFILAEEAFFAADPKSGKVLKTIATSTNAVYENKGKDIRRGISCCRVMMPTNSKWAVPVEAKDRRYFILDVSDKHKEDSAYFAAIDDQMKEGGAAAFLRDLLARGMTFRRMKPAPMTEAKREQILHSLKPEEKWLKSVLTEGQFPVRAEKMMDTPTDWPEPGGAVPKSAVLASFQAYVPGVKGPATPEGLTLFLERYLGKIPKSKPTILGKRTHCYILPPLAEARAAFLRVIPHVEFEAEVDEPDGDSGGTERVVRMRRRGGRF